MYSGNLFYRNDGSNLSNKRTKNGQKLTKKASLRKLYYKGRAHEAILPQTFKKGTIKTFLIFSSIEKVLKNRYLLSYSKNACYPQDPVVLNLFAIECKSQAGNNIPRIYLLPFTILLYISFTFRGTIHHI